MSRCDAVSEALVMGNVLSTDDRTHLETCAACRGLSALPAMLAASSRAEPPRPGFSARMMAAARERIAQRRRRRFATFTFALAAAGASAVAVDRTFFRAQPAGTTSVALPGLSTTGRSPDRDPIEMLESFHDLGPAVDWNRIEAPLAGYRAHVLPDGDHQ
jgi:hypothetical protein